MSKACPQADCRWIAFPKLETLFKEVQDKINKITELIANK